MIPQLDQYADHYLLHTGQNYAPGLSEIFFDELRIRPPNEHLGVQAPKFAQQVGQILERSDDVIERVRPDRVVILGDTNSGLAALAAARRGIPVYHIEAGNRCYDDRVPEEINRRVIDHCSAVLMPYTERSKENLMREGIERERIFVVGNPIYEVLNAFSARIDDARVHELLGTEPGRYILATIHRAENVDLPPRLALLMSALERAATQTAVPVILSVHPRTARRLAEAEFPPYAGVRLIEPLGFFDFVRLERDAVCVITDSGTVQEECAILRVPNVTVRDVTERPETVEAGSNIVAGVEPEQVCRAVELAMELGRAWTAPREYLVPEPSRAILKIILGRVSLRHHTS